MVKFSHPQRLLPEYGNQLVDVLRDNKVVIGQLLQQSEQVLDANEAIVVEVKEMEAETELVHFRPLKHTFGPLEVVDEAKLVFAVGEEKVEHLLGQVLGLESLAEVGL